MSRKKKNKGYTVACDFHFEPGKRGRKKINDGVKPDELPPKPGRIPRVSRLMALAIHYDELLKQGVVKDYAEIARLGGVSRARITQIMNLLLLAPEIQEKILFLPKVYEGRDPITEHELRGLLKNIVWVGPEFLE